jgi:hypothetical protein
VGPRLAKVVDDSDTVILAQARDVCRMLLEQIAHLTDRIDALKTRIAALSNEADLPRQLQTMPGVGPIRLVRRTAMQRAHRRRRSKERWRRWCPPASRCWIFVYGKGASRVGERSSAPNT